MIDANKTTFIDLDARRIQFQSPGIRDPSDCNDGEVGLGGIVNAVAGVVHSYSGRRLHKGVDRAEFFAHVYPRPLKAGGDGDRNILIFGREYAPTGLKKLNP